MKPSAWRRLDLLARELTPFALTLGLIIVGAIPFYVPGLQSVAPSLPFIAVFYWTLHRPDLMPPAAAFVIGLFQDILSGGPIGTGAAVFVVLHAAVRSQRTFFHGKSFTILWLGFAVAAVGAALLASCRFWSPSGSPCSPKTTGSISSCSRRRAAGSSIASVARWRRTGTTTAF
jgi:rod shape-determining protein MreD